MLETCSVKLCDPGGRNSRCTQGSVFLFLRFFFFCSFLFPVCFLRFLFLMLSICEIVFRLPFHPSLFFLFSSLSSFFLPSGQCTLVSAFGRFLDHLSDSFSRRTLLRRISFVFRFFAHFLYLSLVFLCLYFFLRIFTSLQ